MRTAESVIEAQFATLGIEEELRERTYAHFRAAHTVVAEQGVLMEELGSDPFAEVAVRLQLARESAPSLEELSREPGFVLGVMGAVSLRRQVESDEAILVATLEHGHGGSI